MKDSRAGDSLLAELAKIPERAPPLTEGTRLGPYEIRAPLGKGGMGQVYRAQDPRLGREVAIKVLPRLDEDLVRRFEQEARALGALQHPNILSVHDLGAQDGVPYLVFELLDGATLGERLTTDPPSLKEALELAAQIARGLAAAHEKGIVHRDLKPDNVFVMRTGQVKILDFGLAKATASLDGQATAVGVMIGTPHYMSPEQVRGQTVDLRSDIFSFGLVLFEMLSGRHPFRRDSGVETMNNIAREPAPPLLIHGLAYPAVERLVRHCLEKQPDDRFQSARDLVYTLETLIPEAAPRRAWRRWLGVALATAAVAAIAAAGVTAWRAAEKARTFVPAARYRQVTYRSGSIRHARFTPDGHTYVFTAAWDDQPPEPFAAITEGAGARPLGLPRASVLSISASGEMATLLDGARLAIVPLGGGGAPREVATDVVDADFVPGTSTLAAIRSVAGECLLELPLGHVVFRTRAELRTLRVLRDGEHAALLEHPTPGDDGGHVVAIDARGARSELSRGWASLHGLALAGDEIWYTANDGGGMTELHGVSLDGRDRLVATVPGDLTLTDVAPNGQALVTVHHSRQALMALVPGAPQERRFTWLDYSLAVDLSADGRTLLFGETNQGGGPAYSIFLRHADEPLAVRLGDGLPLALSPDEKWVLARPQLLPHSLVLVPTGAGTPVTLTHDAIDHLDGRWLPDGRRVIFLGAEPGRRPRLYVQAIDGAPRALGDEGMTAHFAVAPDGAEVAVADTAGAVWRVSVEGGTSRPLAGLLPRQVPLRFTRDGALLVAEPGRVPLAVDRLLPDGHREPWRVIAPADPGWGSLIFLAPSVDSRFYAYSYTRDTDELSLVDGLLR
jgi:hypothetical protein